MFIIVKEWTTSNIRMEQLKRKTKYKKIIEQTQEKIKTFSLFGAFTFMTVSNPEFIFLESLRISDWIFGFETYLR